MAGSTDEPVRADRAGGASRPARNGTLRWETTLQLDGERGPCEGRAGMPGAALRALLAAALLALAAPLVATTTPPAHAQSGTQDGTRAPVAFEREALTVPTNDGSVRLDVEIADTPQRRSRGLMERTDIAPDEGMLFVFGAPREITMWMRNTPTALDMIFLDPAGTVTHVAPDTVPFSTDIVSSRGPAAFVLEVVAGSAARWGLEPGDRLEGPRFR